MVADAIIVIIISTVGIPTFMTPIPVQDVFIIIAWCIGCTILVNDVLKVFLYGILKRIKKSCCADKKNLHYFETSPKSM